MLISSDGGVFLGIERLDWALAPPASARGSVHAVTGCSVSVAVCSGSNWSFHPLRNLPRKLSQSERKTPDYQDTVGQSSDPAPRICASEGSAGAADARRAPAQPRFDPGCPRCGGRRRCGSRRIGGASFLLHGNLKIGESH
jgi:hypothetical protein